MIMNTDIPVSKFISSTKENPLRVQWCTIWSLARLLQITPRLKRRIFDALAACEKEEMVSCQQVAGVLDQVLSQSLDNQVFLEVVSKFKADIIMNLALRERAEKKTFLGNYTQLEVIARFIKTHSRTIHISTMNTLIASVARDRATAQKIV